MIRVMMIYLSVGKIKSDLNAVGWEVEVVNDKSSPVTCCQGLSFLLYLRVRCNLCFLCLYTVIYILSIAQDQFWFFFVCSQFSVPNY